MRKRVLPAALAALVLAGCSGTAFVQPGPKGDAVFPEGAVRASSLLPARGRSRFRPAEVTEVEEDLPVLRLPTLERWPRTMRQSGAAYALVQLNPYVGQLGVLAEGKRADAGMGYGLVCGYRFKVRGTTAFGLEIAHEASNHTNEVSGTEARAKCTGMGLRASLRADENLSPFVAVGVGGYSLDSIELPPEYDLSGAGVTVRSGAEYSPSRRFSVRTELSVGVWEAADEVGGKGLAATVTIGVGAAVSF
jgi:hypothetical protein